MIDFLENSEVWNRVGFFGAWSRIGLPNPAEHGLV